MAGNVCENTNITDPDDAKYFARMADRFVFRFGADECSGSATNMADRSDSPATSVTSGQTEEIAANPLRNLYTVNITGYVPIWYHSTLYMHVNERR